MSHKYTHAAANLRTAAANELDNILRWWAGNTVDHDNGGFYGRIDGRGVLHPQADKGVILNARILWTFSAAARLKGDPALHHLADRAFDYLQRHFVDAEYGGVYWMLDYKGQPVDTRKQVYAQAFALYAFAEYYRLSGAAEALRHALDLFDWIETRSRDRERQGYFEAFARDGGPLADQRLSDKDANEAKTMNTHLHVLEAYTTLYRASPAESIREALETLTGLFLDRFLDPQTAHLRLFFDENWSLKSDKISFGHDIETAWLLRDAALATGDAGLIGRSEAAALHIADRTEAAGFDPADGGLWNEADAHGLSDRAKEWWPQIEAAVGFLDAFDISGAPRYLDRALRCWHFIDRHLLDRDRGEWYWGLRADGQPDLDRDKAGPWKCPYHNGRGCMELMRRLAG